MPPQARPKVLDAYWRLAAERQQIYLRRLEGQSAPWSNDPILRTYKFCNAYRAADRVSQYLIGQVIYGAQSSYSADDELMRIVLFRLFSKPATWQLLCREHGDVTLATLRSGGLAQTLDRAFGEGQRLYTAAFILCANRSYGFERKHRNHIALLEQMLRPGGLSRAVSKAKSLNELTTALREYPLIGPFMAYQLAIDINYSELCDFDESEFTIAGPGAKRGIDKCFSDIGGHSHEEIIDWITACQDQEFEKRGIKFSNLFGRPLQSIDIQNLFCELDKYARVAFPDLKSNRKRIKAKFTEAGPLPDPFFPPKWGLHPGSATTRL